MLRYHLFIFPTLRLTPRLELSVTTSTASFKGISVQKTIYCSALLTPTEESSRFVSCMLSEEAATSYADTVLPLNFISCIRTIPSASPLHDSYLIHQERKYIQKFPPPLSLFKLKILIFVKTTSFPQHNICLLC